MIQFLFIFVAIVTRVQCASKPHIVFIMADDLGWYNVGFRNPLMNAPVIGKLLENEAALLERHYVFKFCSPTRRSFLSGRLPPHNGMDNGGSAAVDLRMTTIAKKLQFAGYTTGQAGKWHAGHWVNAETPHGRGFNTSLGYFQGMCDHYTQKFQECNHATDLWNTNQPGHGLNGTYGDFLYVGRAVETIMTHDPSKPLFFYLALQCAHDPVQAPQIYKDLYNKSTCPDVGEYAMATIVDEAVKNVTHALKTKGMWENTFLVFSSDNGGPAFSDQKAASNFPLRGGKYTSWEGGIRATAFVSGGLLPKSMRGKNISAPIHICDWYATFANLAGIDPTDNHTGVPPIDSLDQWPVVTGKSKLPIRTEIYPLPGVLIQGNWKIIVGKSEGNSAAWSGPLFPKVPAVGPKSIDCSAGCLYDVVIDPSERNDVSKEHKYVVSNMTARLKEMEKTNWSPTYPTKKFSCDKTEANGGYLTPSDWVPPKF